MIGHRQLDQRCPKSANRRHRLARSITSSAAASSASSNENGRAPLARPLRHRQISISVAKLLRQTPISKLGLKNDLLRLYT